MAIRLPGGHVVCTALLPIGDWVSDNSRRQVRIGEWGEANLHLLGSCPSGNEVGILVTFAVEMPQRGDCQWGVYV